MVELLTAPKVKPAFTPTDYQSRFQEGRKGAGFSLAKVAEAAGVSLQAISQFERGAQGLQLAHFVAACDALGLDVKWVLKGEGAMFVSGRPIGGKRGGRKAERI